MGLILDLIPDPPAVLWSFTTQASSVDFYIQPDYIVRPLTWTLDFGVRGWDSPVPDGTIEVVPSFVSAHEDRNRDGDYGWGNSFTFTLDGEDYVLPELLSREYVNLDERQYKVQGEATLDTRGFLEFTEVNFTVYNQRELADHAYSVIIDWGDGTTTTDAPPLSPSRFGPGGGPGDLNNYTYNHTYADPGVYQIKVITEATSLTPGDAADNLLLYWVLYPVSTPFTYGLTIDWGDGTTDTYSAVTTGHPVNDDDQLSAVHAYEDPGPHTISITAAEGRWVPDFWAGGQEYITELGPMACGFRLGCDLAETFRNLGASVFAGAAIDPGFRTDNVMFMHYTFENARLAHYSKLFPFAPDLPFLSLRALRGGYYCFAYLYEPGYLGLEAFRSLHLPMLQAESRGYFHISDYEIFDDLLELDYFYGGPEGLSDALYAYLDSTGIEDGVLEEGGLITTVAGEEAGASLSSKGWSLGIAYRHLGLYFKDDYYAYRVHQAAPYDYGLWIDTAPTGVQLKIMVHRTPWLDPGNPQTATVDWSLTHRLYTYTLFSNYWGSYYSWVSGPVVTISSGTLSFAPGETKKLISVNYTGPIHQLNQQSDYFSQIGANLVNPSNEDIDGGSINWLVNVRAGGPTGYTTDNSYHGLWVFSEEVFHAPISGGLDITFNINRSHVLNPVNPGTASVDWQISMRLAPPGQSAPYSAYPVFTTIASGTATFSSTENTKTINEQYIGSYTPYTNGSSPYSQLRVKLLNPVNERLGSSEVIATVNT